MEKGEGGDQNKVHTGNITVGNFQRSHSITARISLHTLRMSEHSGNM